MSEPDANPLPSALAEFRALRHELDDRIVGQSQLVTRLVIALLCDGHLLVEGVPGLAKTTAVKALAAQLAGDFHRIQFTPDLLPADLTGTEVFRPSEASFSFQPGPLFHNVLLADEINRAGAKVQSALLEAMEERQVTVGRVTYPLPELFLVMATQNPIEQDGTYPLPEAQLDRFLLKVEVDYPAPDAERAILALGRQEARAPRMRAGASTGPSLDAARVFAARNEVLDVFLAEQLEQYLIDLVLCTRAPSERSSELARWIRLGASPRATLGLDRAARAHAWLNGRDYVSPDDIVAMAPDVLRHRLLLSYEAQADGVGANAVIDELIRQVPVP